ncbi:MAG: heterodisulfide reductase subunit A, partial [Phycisphaerae bacterium SG8_4]
MEKKVAVYICRGCDIGDSLDIEALSSVAGENGAAICREHECLCGDDGGELIRQDIRDGVNALVVAACTPRFKTDTFTFDGCRTERVNLREHVVWSHEPNDEDTQMLADDYLRMGLARAKKAEIPAPFDEEIDQTVLVVGGGITGITAALDAAGAGHNVVLVEREARLGGWSGKFARTFPH